MRTLIKGGTIVTAEQEFVGDILVEDEIIRAMGAHLDEKADRGAWRPSATSSPLRTS